MKQESVTIRFVFWSDHLGCSEGKWCTEAKTRVVNADPEALKYPDKTELLAMCLGGWQWRQRREWILRHRGNRFNRTQGLLRLGVGGEKIVLIKGSRDTWLAQ